MNLKDFFASRENPPELYWSLVLEPGWVQAGVWYIGEGEAQIVSVSPATPWETEEELTGAVDAALSSAIQKLPEGQEPDKTVFGVSSSWVKDGEIKEEYLDKIKKLCAELSLTPVGFVVLPEAIAHLFKSEEGSPLSAVVLGLGKEFLEISVFKLGNLSGTTQVARSVSLVEDVTEGLSRFEGASPLPSRFIIYDGKGAELTEARETIMQESWENAGKISFLHTPKVEEFASDRKVLATSLAGANEISQVSKISSKEISSEGEESSETTPQNVAPPKSDLSPEELGFVLGGDVTQTQVPVPSPQPAPISSQPGPVPPKFATDYLQKTKSLFHGFTERIKNALTAPEKPIGKKSFTKAGIIVASGLVLLALLWWFYPKAKVTIYVSPQTFQEEVNIRFSTEGKFDIGAATVPAETAQVEVSGDKTKATSGTKTIGDKAKGTAKIQNGTAFPINLTAGTLLVSSGNLKFAMDNSASVSAALSPSSPGTVEVPVTAESIGAEYNLAKDEVFKVGNYPKAEVDATSIADFSGGSSQQISAVSQEDQAALSSELSDELSQDAKDQLLLKVGEDKIFIDDLADLSVTSEKYDHKVGDEATNLKLSLTVSATGVVADKTKLLEYAREELKGKIPSGFVLRDSHINFGFDFGDKEEADYIYNVRLGANFLPQTDTNEIKKKIVGKSPDVTQDFLSSVPGFTRAEITQNVRLPGFLGVLPHIGRNITVEIVADK